MLVFLNTPVRKGPIPWHALAWVGFIYPVLEEFIFRGTLQPKLKQYAAMQHALIGITAANMITSVLFAALHLLSQPLIWAVLVFFPSLVFGWMRDYYGKLHASIALHIFYNVGFVWLFTLTQ